MTGSPQVPDPLSALDDIDDRDPHRTISDGTMSSSSSGDDLARRGGLVYTRR